MYVHLTKRRSGWPRKYYIGRQLKEWDKRIGESGYTKWLLNFKYALSCTIELQLAIHWIIVWSWDGGDLYSSVDLNTKIYNPNVGVTLPPQIHPQEPLRATSVPWDSVETCYLKIIAHNIDPLIWKLFYDHEQRKCDLFKKWLNLIKQYQIRIYHPKFSNSFFLHGSDAWSEYFFLSMIHTTEYSWKLCS